MVLQLKDKIGKIGQKWEDDEIKLKLLSLLGLLEMHYKKDKDCTSRKIGKKEL